MTPYSTSCLFLSLDTSSTTTSIKLESIGNNGTDLFYPVVGGDPLAICLEFRNHHPNHHPRKKKMKPYAFLALIVVIAAFVGTIAAIETPRKKEKKVAHILPKVEDMYENPYPLQF